MAALLSALTHRLRARFLDTDSAIEEARADLLQGTFAPEPLASTIENALRILEDATIADTELLLVSRTALGLAERLRQFLEDAAPDVPERLTVLCDEFADQAEMLALAADPELESAADRIRSDAASGRLAYYADWKPFGGT